MSAELRRPSSLLGFTGLIPIVAMVPILLMHLYAVGIVVGLACECAVITCHLGRAQGVTSMDLVTIAFGALNAVLYFGFADRLIVANLDIAIYTTVVTMIAVSLVQRDPWTTQFAKRMVPASSWQRPAFQAINMRITALWGASFVACDVIALTACNSIRLLAPVVLLGATAAAVLPLVSFYRVRMLSAKQL